jgi:glyoxylase-like metal-dependent hydrolase (beta-lactamase superfamily II)
VSAHELSPGVPHRLSDQVVRIVAPNGGPMTGAGTNTYLVGTDELMVIDPGPDDESHVQAILSAGEGRIRWILCTHTHEDHSPAAGRLKAVTGARVGGMASPRTDHDSELDIDRLLGDGDTVQCAGTTLSAVHTPGHASNHLCFLLAAAGMLFTGDHIMQGSTVVIWPPDGNMRAYLDSLRRLFSLELRSLAPGHGTLIPEPHAELDRLIRHRMRREEKVKSSVLQAGMGVTVRALLPFAYDDVPETLYGMAALSLRAHLEKLVEDGEMRCVDGVYFSTHRED